MMHFFQMNKEYYIYGKRCRHCKDQVWMFAFVPVKKDANGVWIEDLSVKIESSKDNK